MKGQRSKSLVNHDAVLFIKSEEGQKKFEKIIAGISKTFINISSEEDFDKAVNNALKKVRLFFNADRSYIFEFSKDLKTMSYIYENCAEGVSKQVGRFIDVPVESMPWWFKQLCDGKYIHIPNVDLMPKEASVEQFELKDQDIKSLIVFPIKKQDSLIGFYGIDEVKEYKKWSEEEIVLLEILADIFAMAYDKKQAETSLEEVNIQKQQQQNFVSIVSHEFKTPLSIIDSSAQRILRKIDSMDNHEIISRMERIHNNVLRLNNLVETTLSLSRLEAGKLSINTSMNDLKDVVSSVVLETRYTNPDRVIKFQHSGNTVGIFDPNRIFLVVNNLISNAIKYSSDEVNVICDEKDEKYIRIMVSDKGCGLSDEDLSQIGNKFFRAKQTEDIPGTGVGVYLVKSIIEMHGGKMEVESELGKGSTFIVLLLKNNTNI